MSRFGLGFVSGNSGIYINNFSQYTAGTTPGDWTNRYVTGGFTYVVQAVAGSISGKVLRWTKTVANRQAISWNAVPNVADVEVLIRARSIVAITATALTVIGSYVRGSGAAGTEGGIRCAIGTSTTYTNQYGGNLVVYVSGTATILGVPQPGALPTYTTNAWYYHRFRVTGSTLQYKLWQSGQAEPGSWTDTQTNSTVPAAGWVGLQNADTASNAEVDYFAVSTKGLTIPVPV